ncbi:hypothetical protein OBBRIDRAFT_310654 [Obba rivulosa]|uniref:RanBP2-type domain-containing protein n=1 Tax=Obba rivulosa TaxID=1052685 RepID=A0A8E2ANK0_9APHY|nr:hypothetical protein OBBRIDRAFT_310654 [Obba rivulosa]
MQSQLHAQVPPPPPPPRRVPIDPPSTTATSTQPAPFQFQFNIPPPSSSTSPSENMKIASSFLRERAHEGKPLNQIELAGLYTLLGGGQQDAEPRRPPFRFESTPSTPRDGSPTPILAFVTPSTSSNGTSSEPSRVPLTKNPNGEYFYQGIGLSKVVSKKRKQNQYQSPAFGPSRPGRPMPEIKMEKPKAEAKRRRMGDNVPSSVSESASTTSVPRSQPDVAPPQNGPNAPSTSTTTILPTTATTNGVPSTSSAPKPNGILGAAPVTPPRSRAPPKPSVPAVPSPLRQAWGQSDSSPQASPPQPQKQTRAASFMSEILKEVTPPKRPDIINPYQAANPIPRPPKKPLVRKPRETKPAQPPAQPAEKKEAPVSAQAAIEATVPKGSKRSRPPPELKVDMPALSVPSFIPFAAPASATSRTAQRVNGINGTNRTSHATAVVEEVGDEDMPSPPKKPKTAPLPTSRPQSRTVTVEEVDDVDMASSSQPTLPSEVVEPGEDKGRSESPPSTSVSNPFVPQGSPQRPLFGGVKSSAPRAPSKLRFSFQAEKEEKEETATVPPASQPFTAPAAATPTFQPFRPPAAFQPPKPAETPSVKPADAKATVLAMRAEELPKYTIPLPASSPGAGPSTYRAKEAACATFAGDLPKYDLSAPAQPTASSSGFNWAAAGMKPPPQPTAGTWTCSVCSLSNPAKATEKCTVCETPRPDAPKSAPAATSFNWAAAGMKPPPAPAADTWKCSMCMLNNSANVSKCTVCEEPRADVPKPAVQGFNWAAAGMKPPPAPAADTWNCSVCMLNNPASAGKCTVCESPR